MWWKSISKKRCGWPSPQQPEEAPRAQETGKSVMDNELQIALIAAGVGAVVLILAYNKWQEHKHKRKAERAFKSEHRDVLLDKEDSGKRESALTKQRREPKMAAAESDGLAPLSTLGGTDSFGRGAPGLPEMLDPRADCAIYLEAMDALAIEQLWQAQASEFKGLGKTLRWFGFSEEKNVWRQLKGGSEGSCHWFCAALQLVDRRGALGEHELMRFTGGMQRIADRTASLPPALPASIETLHVADELDRFCADVDIQIGINLLALADAFSGEELAAFASRQDLSLASDGIYHAFADDGRSLFSLGNLEAEPFPEDELNLFSTRAVTLVIDVPLVRDGTAAFDRMMSCAERFASEFNAAVVDDNHALFGADAAALIREQIRQFQDRMSEHGIPAGSALATRLFSA